MAWAVPEHARSQVNAAGTALIFPSSSPDAARRALGVVNNWRASHSVPLNAVRANLRNHVVAESGEEALIAQRFKRLSSIEAKLRRSRHMQLARMQDVGGCRAVLPSTGSVRNVVRRFERSRTNHELLRRYDYMTQPRASGYRGVHLVYGYRTKRERNTVYNGMRIEIQLRSRLQHAWATAVETVDTFSGSPTRACSWPPSGRRLADCLTAASGQSGPWRYRVRIAG